MNKAKVNVENMLVIMGDETLRLKLTVKMATVTVKMILIIMTTLTVTGSTKMCV